MALGFGWQRIAVFMASCAVESACTLTAGIDLELGTGDIADASSSGDEGETFTDSDAPPRVLDDDGRVAADSGSGNVDVRFDLGTIPDVDPAAVPCGAVDLLFVVDDSASMADEQLNLVASYPGFIFGIESLLGESTDWHVGVITTDAYAFNAPGCKRIGALVDRTGGNLSSAAVCGPFAEGGRYMTGADDLESAFSCAAQVGIEGDGVERPMDALTAALRDTADLGGCNEGFLRDDALLVIVLVTDEEDSGDSAGDPATWYETIVAARGGDPSQVVMLSLVGHPKPNECIATQWTGMMGAEIAPRLIELTEMFEHGFVADVCAADYGLFFEEALAGIAAACDVPAQG